MVKARGPLAALALALLWRSAARGWAARLVSADGGSKTVVLVGGTGSGKSTLANFLAGDGQVFRTGQGGSSVTTETQVERRSFFGDASLGTIELVDTPGLMDTQGLAVDQEQWAKVVERLVADVHSTHALVLVLNGQSRVTQEVKGAVTRLRESFGRDFWRVLHIVVTRAAWGEGTAAEIEATRRLMVQTEEQVVGQEFVDAAIRETIAHLPVYGVDMMPFLASSAGREEKFEMQDIEDQLGGLSLSQLIRLDQQLQGECSRHGFATFSAWKREDKGLKKKMKGQKGLYAWGQHYGNLNLAALEAFRLHVQGTDEAMQLNPSKLVGDTRKIRVRVAAENGVLLQVVPFHLSAEVQVAQVKEQCVYTVPLVGDLRKQPAGDKSDGGWLERVTLFLGGDEPTAVVTDQQLQREAGEVLAQGDKAPSEMLAVVRFKPGSPPAKLDFELLQACFSAGDAGAASALVRDRLTSAAQLTIIAEADLAERLPRTKEHGDVFERVRKLHLEQRARLQSAPDIKESLASQRQQRQERLKAVQETETELKPYLDDLKAEVEARKDEAAQARNATVQRAQDMLRIVQVKDFLKVPERIPDTATDAELDLFVKRLESGLAAVEENARGEALGAHDLVKQSRVLKGMRLSMQLEATTQDMVWVVGEPDLRKLMTPATSGIASIEEILRADTSVAWARKAMEVGGSSFSASVEGSVAGFIGGGVGALHFATKIATAQEESKEAVEQGRKQESRYSMTRHHVFPMQVLQLDAKDLALTATVLREIASIINTREQEHWPEELMRFFGVHGTHVCPSVELGGVWTQEAHFRQAKSFGQDQVKEAMSTCMSVDAEGGGSWFGMMGFGRVSAAVQSRACAAKSTAGSAQVEELYRSTTISRRCFSNLRYCPASPQDFERGLTLNSNWVATDRQLRSCIAVWDLVAKGAGDVVQVVLEGRDAQKAAGIKHHITSRSEAVAAVDEFQRVAAKTWHGKVLDVVRFCSSPLIEKKPEGCQRATDPGYLQMKVIDLEALWQDLVAEGGKEAKRRKECALREFCHAHELQGQCVWRTTGFEGEEQLVCVCNKHYHAPGTNCAERIPRKACAETRWNPTTAHPGSWYQKACETYSPLGEWKYDTWEYSGGGLRWRCKREYECDPETPDHDCCPAGRKGPA